MISFELCGGLKLLEIRSDNLFCCMRLLQGHPKASSHGFRGISKNVCMIRFESFGGSKLDKIGPDNVFCYIRLFQSHPEASSDGFKGVSEGCVCVC